MSQVLADLGENGKAVDDLNSALLTLEDCFDARWDKCYEQIEAERSVDG